ncbi:hypothetical protein PQR01_38315, partial [Paraburkholderia rhynchosiae]
MPYVPYGYSGQGQFGVDLVPDNPKIAIPVVGQCKLRESASFTLKDLKAELTKTDGFPGSIKLYVLYTTATRHVSIQDALQSGQYLHTRSNGETCEVLIVYWDDITDLECVPPQLRAQMFPGAFQLFSAATAPAADSAAFIASLHTFKAFVPTVFPVQMFHWLESWNFALGYVPSSMFNRITNLCIEIDRAEHGKNGVHDFLYIGDRSVLV